MKIKIEGKCVDQHTRNGTCILDGELIDKDVCEDCIKETLVNYFDIESITVTL